MRPVLEEDSRLGEMIRWALNEGSIDDLREDLVECRVSVVDEICEVLPNVSREVVLAVWDLGIEILANRIEAGSL